MSSEQLPEHLRDKVKLAVTHYARFYAELVGNQNDTAEREMAAISALDQTVKALEGEEAFSAYFERRSQLMRIFHFQLMKTLEGQVHQDILDKAGTLLERLEKTSY